MSVADVYTTGYPRSGSTWIGRLLSDLLDCPLSNVQPVDPPMDMQFCQHDGGKYVVRKTHWLCNQWPGDGKIVLVQRDPRDIAISAMFYRNLKPTIENLSGVISWMCSDIRDQPEKYMMFHEAGHYEKFIRCWLLDDRIIETKYELLQKQPILELRRLGIALTGKARPDWQLQEIVQRQSFERWAPKFKHSMRRGVVGDWKKYFKKRHGEVINKCLGQLMMDTGYIDNFDWWRTLP